MANPTQNQIRRHNIKLTILSQFHSDGIGGLIAHTRMHANAHPDVMLCANDVAQFGLYLGKDGKVWYFIRAIGNDPVVVEKIIKLSKGLSCDSVIIENDKKSRNALIMRMPNVSWWAMSPQDLKTQSNGCLQMQQVFLKI